MSLTTSRTNRQVGSFGDTWHDEGRNKWSEWLGIQWLVKIFNYKNPKSKAQNGAWMMHEYNLVANDIVSTPTTTVACHLRKKQPKRKRQLDDEEKGDDDMDKNCKRSTEATTNSNSDKHLSLDGADAPKDQLQYYNMLLTDDILSTEPSDSNDALRQRQIVGNGEEMALDDDYFHYVI
ncbi:unnamed protein product [Dovyalis caffra]|uniref:NAC domain-containing protein n=1 Tax=Dovyalis caffra TaxID=77055 RepID=A0AAV1RQ23_9ROSI|nr:unnamed protein product [Dovyalis caffra]